MKDNVDGPGRRRALRRMVASAGVGVAGWGGLSGCGHRSRAIEPPPPTPSPIHALAVLPVMPDREVAGSGFGRAPVPYIVPVPVGQPGRPAPRVSAAQAVGIGLLAGLVAYGVETHRANEREALRHAMEQVAFDPADFIDERLTAALADQQVNVVRVTDPAIGWAVAANEAGHLPPEVDAVLQISLREAGFQSSMRAGGYYPVLQLDARIRPAQPRDDDIESFGYYADWRDGGKDRRWVKTPPSLTFGTLEQLRDGASVARSGLEEVTARIVTLMAEDVGRVVAGQPRID